MHYLPTKVFAGGRNVSFRGSFTLTVKVTVYVSGISGLFNAMCKQGLHSSHFRRQQNGNFDDKFEEALTYFTGCFANLFI